MSDSNAPQGMITVEEFAANKGMALEKVVSMIKEGFYHGQLVGEQWYVMADEQVAIDGNGVNISYRSEYETSRKVSRFLIGLGWFVVVMGVFAAIIGLADGFSSRRGMGLLGAIPGLIAVISGLFMVVAAQVTRATVDNADHTREILKLLQQRDAGVSRE